MSGFATMETVSERTEDPSILPAGSDSENSDNIGAPPQRPTFKWQSGSPQLTPYDIVVVGGGASAVLQVARFLDFLAEVPNDKRPPVNIYVAYKNTRVGRGNVYLSHQSELDVNQAAKHMSLAGSSDPDDFAKFLQDRREDDEKIEDARNFFSPRSDFGFYAEEFFGKLVSKGLALGARVTPLRNTSVGNVIPLQSSAFLANTQSATASGFRVRFFDPNADVPDANDRDGYGIDAKQVFLAIGHIVRDQSTAYKNCFGITDKESYDRASERIRHLPDNNATIASIGYGPTTIDYLRMLYQWRFEGHHTIFQRHKMSLWANRPERENVPYALGFGLKDLQNLASLHKDGDVHAIEKGVIDLIAQEIAKAEDANSSGYRVLYGREFVKLFSEDIKTIGDPAFIRVAAKTAERFMAATIPAADLERIKHRNVDFKFGDARIVGEENDRVVISYASMEDGQSLEVAADMVLIGNPWDTDYRREPLLSRISRNGLGRFDDEKGMLLCNAHGELTTGARDTTGLFGIGPFAKYNGRLIHPWGIESFDRQATAAAGRAIRNMMVHYHGPNVRVPLGIATPA